MKSSYAIYAASLILVAFMLSSCGPAKKDKQTVVSAPDSVKSVEPDVNKVAEQDLQTPSEVAAGPLEVTIEEAVLLALENNRSLRIERLNPLIRKTFAEQEFAVFEPVVSADVSTSREKAEDSTGTLRRSKAAGGNLEISEFLPTGTTIGLGASSDRTEDDSADPRYASQMGLTVTQALLQGRGVAVNLATLRQAKLDTVYSEYELRGFAESLVAKVETTYWQYVLSLKQVDIVQQSLEVAQKQLEDTQHRIRVGEIAETELAAAEAEVALRREAMINVNSRVETFQVQLLRLLYPQRLPKAEREIIPKTEALVPANPDESLKDHVEVALRMRPDLCQAMVLLQSDKLEIVKTRNGLLPKMDLFITLGKTGYANSFNESFNNINDGGYDKSIELRFQYPLSNRDARAQHKRALLTREQQNESLENLRDLARQDVEQAFIEVKRTRQQVDATATTRRFQEEKLRAETAKFQVGKSTALLVAAAQRDLLSSQASEVESVTNYLNARISLYLLEGSLLERRGINAPGREPVAQKR